MANTNQLTPQQRAHYFAQYTRKNLQALPAQSFSAEGDRIQFVLPKARYLACTFIEVEAVAKAKGSGTLKVSDYPADIFNRVSLDLNNGFMPFVLSGRDLNIYDMIRMYPDVARPHTSPRAAIHVENAISADGTNNKIHIMLPMQNVLSEKDAIGLIMLQNDSTQVVLTLDLDSLAKAYNLAEGQSVEFVSCKVTPWTETFTIPSIEQARPDISTLKLLSSKYEVFSANSQTIVKQPIGTIYRKMILFFEDEQGNPMTAADFTGNIELVFNQADTPISIKPAHLEYLNQHYYGAPLPDGVFVLDFASVPLPNLATSRDLVDSERLTELWVRFTPNTAGKVTSINETISRLVSA